MYNLKILSKSDMDNMFRKEKKRIKTSKYVVSENDIKEVLNLLDSYNTPKRVKILYEVDIATKELRVVEKYPEDYDNMCSTLIPLDIKDFLTKPIEEVFTIWEKYMLDIDEI